MRSPSALSLLALGLLVGPGCGSLDVSLPGKLQSPLVEAAGSSADEPLLLAFDRLGVLTVNGRVLNLPDFVERRRLGLSVVDASAAPPGWRPRHCPEGGLLVSSLAKASPLAVAGLRPFDQLLELDGLRLRTLDDLAPLAQIEPEQEVELVALDPSGVRQRLVVQAAEEIGSTYRLRVPGLFERQSSSAGGSLGLGPFDVLFYRLDRVDHAYVSDAERLAHSRYGDRSEWGLLGNMIQRLSWVEPASGRERSRWRLLWLFTLDTEGDPEGGPEADRADEEERP